MHSEMYDRLIGLFFKYANNEAIARFVANRLQGYEQAIMMYQIGVFKPNQYSMRIHCTKDAPRKRIGDWYITHFAITNPDEISGIEFDSFFGPRMESWDLWQNIQQTTRPGIFTVPFTHKLKPTFTHKLLVYR